MCDGSVSRLRLGAGVAVASVAIDQAHKWWMLRSVNIAERQPIEVTGFLDLVLVWNYGISYGLLAQDSVVGQWILIGVTVLVIVGLGVWLVSARRLSAAVGLGLLIGGALGNLIDRLVHGAVADFFSFHAYGFRWYVFNLADVMIVAGVAFVLYELWSGKPERRSMD